MDLGMISSITAAELEAAGATLDDRTITKQIKLHPAHLEPYFIEKKPRRKGQRTNDWD